MRISDGSSDVCSSDLRDLVRPVQPEGARDLALARGRIGAGDEIEDLLSRRQAGLWFGFRHRTRDTASRGRRHPRNQYARPIRIRSTAGAPVNTHVPSAAAASRGALRTVSLSALSRSSTCLSATPGRSEENTYELQSI